MAARAIALKMTVLCCVAHLELYVWPALRKFYDDNGHLRVPQNDQTCGRVVSNIRSHGTFLQHADFAMWLWCACFQLNARDGAKNRRRWEEVWARKVAV